MPDVRVAPNVVISDGTTLSQLLAIDASGRASVSLTASSATVTVDSELPTAAALADGFANPTAPSIGAMNSIWNGATWDRVRGAAAALDSTGTGISNSALVGQFDDAATQTVTENQFAHVRISTRRALLVEGVASGTVIPVSLTSTTITGTVTVDSELPTAAALTDNFANPTVPGVGGFNMLWDGATWDRMPGSSVGGAFVQGDVAHDAVLSGNPQIIGGRSSAAAPADVSADGDATRIWVLRNGAQAAVITAAGALIGGDGANGLDVDVTRVSGTVTVDSELPTAAALGDAVANPTVPAVGAYLVGYNGATWDRVRTANTGRLQVDVISGGGAETPTAPVNNYDTTASIAAGASDDHDTVDFGAATRKVTTIIFGASVPLRAELKYVDNGVATTMGVFWSPAGETITVRPPHRDYWSRTFAALAGFDGFRLTRTNMDASEAADVYSNIMYES